MRQSVLKVKQKCPTTTCEYKYYLVLYNQKGKWYSKTKTYKRKGCYGPVKSKTIYSKKRKRFEPKENITKKDSLPMSPRGKYVQIKNRENTSGKFKNKISKLVLSKDGTFKIITTETSNENLKGITSSVKGKWLIKDQNLILNLDETYSRTFKITECKLIEIGLENEYFYKNKSTCLPKHYKNSG